MKLFGEAMRGPSPARVRSHDTTRRFKLEKINPRVYSIAAQIPAFLLILIKKRNELKLKTA